MSAALGSWAIGPAFSLLVTPDCYGHNMSARMPSRTCPDCGASVDRDTSCSRCGSISGLDSFVVDHYGPSFLPGPLTTFSLLLCAGLLALVAALLFADDRVAREGDGSRTPRAATENLFVAQEFERLARAPEIPKPARLTIEVPEVKRVTSAARIRLWGYVSRGAKVTVDGRPARRIKLGDRPGWERIVRLPDLKGRASYGRSFVVLATRPLAQADAEVVDIVRIATPMRG